MDIFGICPLIGIPKYFSGNSSHCPHTGGWSKQVSSRLMSEIQNAIFEFLLILAVE